VVVGITGLYVVATEVAKRAFYAVTSSARRAAPTSS